MKICVTGTRGFPFIEGGVEKHCEALYPYVAQTSDVVVFRRKPYVTGDGGHANIHFIDLPSTKIKGFEAVWHTFLSVLRMIAIHPDVAHFHNIGPGLFIPLIKLASIPVVLTYHSPNYEHKKWGFFARKLLRFCESISLKFADRIIFVNQYQMEKYSPEVQKKSRYIPNGITALIKTENRNYLDAIGVEPGKYILSVGRITPEKGFHTLIQAYKDQNLAGCKLVIAGGVEFESGYMEKLKQLCGDADVVFTGFVQGETLAQLYSNAALFVLASENEGFPLVLLEAMGYGRDVLVSDIPATHLVKLEAEDYFPTGQSDVLGQKLREKLTNKVSREYDLTGYNWENIAKQTANVLLQAAKSRME